MAVCSRWIVAVSATMVAVCAFSESQMILAESDDVRLGNRQSREWTFPAVDPAKASEFEKCLAGVPFAKIGTVTAEPVVKWAGAAVPVEALTHAYKSTLAGL